MLDIEKENLMTVSSALRSIPKKQINSDNNNSDQDEFDILFK